MKLPLIDSLDTIHARMVGKNAAHVVRWGVECREWPLSDVANISYDGRRTQRNFDLIDALAADERFVVTCPPGTNFANARIALRA